MEDNNGFVNKQITKYQTDKIKLVPGATYKVTEDGTNNSVTAVTRNDGKLEFKNLYVEKKYAIEEIKTPNNYVLNSDVITFTTNVNGADLVFDLESGNLREDFVIEKQEGQEYKAILKVEDDVKAKIKIIKTEEATDKRLKNAKYRLIGPNFESGHIITTDDNGEVLLEGLLLDKEYILEEVKAPKGYYLNNDQIKFVVNSNSGEYTVEVKEGNIKNNSLVIEDEIPLVIFEVEDEKIPTYNLTINNRRKI